MRLRAADGVRDRRRRLARRGAGRASGGPDGPEDSLPKEIARGILGSVPTIAGAGLTAPIAYRWKTQINENAKSPAFSHELPEMDHNEIVGWEGAGDLGPFSLDPARRRRPAPARAPPDRADAVGRRAERAADLPRRDAGPQRGRARVLARAARRPRLGLPRRAAGDRPGAGRPSSIASRSSSPSASDRRFGQSPMNLLDPVKWGAQAAFTVTATAVKVGVERRQDRRAAARPRPTATTQRFAAGGRRPPQGAARRRPAPTPVTRRGRRASPSPAPSPRATRARPRDVAPEPRSRRRRAAAAGRQRQHRRRRAEVVETEGAAAPGATLRVEAPWDGYDEMKAAEIVERVRESPTTPTKAVVRLYERTQQEAQVGPRRRRRTQTLTQPC